MSDEPLRLGVLGCAHAPHAASYISGLQRVPGVEVAAIYDTDAERAARFAERFSIGQVARASDALLGRNDLAAVVVCSPTDQHAAHVIAAAQANKHVLCEKPLATTLADGRAMIDACNTAGVQLHVAFVCRFYPMVLAAKTMIANGEIGAVRAVMGGNRGRPPRALPWLLDAAQAGGGALIDHSVHVADAMRFVLGDEIARVSAESGTLFANDLAVDDAALMLLELRSGAVASIDPSWSMPEANPFHYDFFLRVLGADGVIVMDDTRQALHVASDQPGTSGFALAPFGVNVDHALVAHFVQCVRAGAIAAPAASGEDGLRALEIALAAYASARAGQPITLPLQII
jgi:predicted dehydrogenase